ncbi:alanine racemase, partial [Phytoactinopolyspora endophytica]|uniref:alanine racemase n=1 Tax=Phytoactinopolyspora endophytica TaxID=1642495 RepID=UPI0030B85C8A
MREVTTDWTIDGCHRSFPHTALGMPATRIPEAGWRLHDHFATPIMSLKASALSHNLDRMRRYCEEHGVRIAPHGKTTMSPELIRRQLDHGAWGMTAATAWQARTMVAFGARRVIIANECIDPAGLAGLVDLLRARADVELLAYVDSVETVEAMSTALRDAATRPFPVLVEMGVAGGRAGARSIETALEVGRAVAASPE